MIYLRIAAALAVLALLGYGAHIYKKAQRLDQVESQLTQEKADRAADRKEFERQAKVNTEISNGYQSDIRRLESERANVPVVRMCKPKPQQLPAEARPASGSDATSSRHVSEAPEVDIGPDIGGQLIDYGIACEANMLQLERLQEWVKSR